MILKCQWPYMKWTKIMESLWQSEWSKKKEILWSRCPQAPTKSSYFSLCPLCLHLRALAPGCICWGVGSRGQRGVDFFIRFFLFYDVYQFVASFLSFLAISFIILQIISMFLDIIWWFTCISWSWIDYQQKKQDIIKITLM